MTSFQVVVSESVRSLLADVDDKTERIIKDNLSKLESPYPGRGAGDKERLPVDGNEKYRLHIGRTWTAFYEIEDDENLVRVLEVLPIDEAHKRYGF
ncbi:plasmid stabilization system [Natrialba hulunbeirensis JCM 10989]|uniref:Plasmid stabilization system n=1 Tax=Natrialba hulunbeirensis JCM 10989 TaxID=1227493 RepID=L9ZQD8_9EURY|nr:type II toxin-antitoxin system RelE/ParE family toxin [Natrialba hulunbeirensis]ELY88720.1 plasmid stabilization system [Natrialba hulunbeirensis JCM 10989]